MCTAQPNTLISSLTERSAKKSFQSCQWAFQRAMNGLINERLVFGVILHYVAALLALL